MAESASKTSKKSKISFNGEQFTQEEFDARYPELPDNHPRKCSFRPSTCVIKVAFPSPSGGEPKQADYLMVSDRIRWFLTYCEENPRGPKDQDGHRLAPIRGFIDESDVRFVQALNMVKSTCNVYMDGVLVATGIAGCSVAGADDTILQRVATKAKGRALANAGFTVAGAEEDAVPNDPCDGGHPVRPAYTAMPNAPIQNSAGNPILQIMEGNTSCGSLQEDSPASEETPRVMTVEQAKALKSDLFQGKTFGEVIATKGPNQAEYYAGPSFRSAAKYPEVVEAAKVILANLGDVTGC